MRITAMSAALSVALLGLGCSNQAGGGGSSAGGSVAITHDDALVYAADSDLDTVFIVNTATEESTAVVVGRQPEKVLMAPDDTAYVTNRMGRSVSVIRRGETTESARLDVGVEPVSLAVSSDNKTLYVVNATALTSTEFGTVMAFDVATLKLKWETPVGFEPRGIALVDDSHAIVTLFKTGDVALVDLSKGRVVKEKTDLHSQLNATALGLNTRSNDTMGRPTPPDIGFSRGPQTVHARGLDAIITSPDGKQVYGAALLSTETVLQTRDTNGFPSPDQGTSTGGYSGGSCGASAVAAPAVLTFDDQAVPQVDDVTACASGALDRPPMLIISNIPGTPVQGPSAVALDPTGSFIYVVNHNSNNVTIVPTSVREPNSTAGVGGGDVPKPLLAFGGTVKDVVNVGAAPTGIALSHDGRRAWVYNAFDHSLSRIEGSSPNARNSRPSEVRTLTLGRDVLPDDVVAGRRLFFSAVDPRMNNPATGIACGTCHLEGREDGHVWNFPDGPRQTPSLSARMTAKTAPFHWNGEFPDLMAFMTHTVQKRMGGSIVTPVMERQVAAFLGSLEAPDNPHKTSTSADVVKRGRAVFEKAGCQSCHAGEAFTDNNFANVGTYVTKGEVVDDMQFLPKGLNTPSLLGVARTAPYLHDGSAMTLKERITTGKDRSLHGSTAQLSDGEVDDLVSYLKTL